MLEHAVHIGLRINKERFGLHKEEQGWFIVNRKGQYLSDGLWSSVGRDYFQSAADAYERLLQINPIQFDYTEYSSVSQ